MSNSARASEVGNCCVSAFMVMSLPPQRSLQNRSETQAFLRQEANALPEWHRIIHGSCRYRSPHGAGVMNVGQRISVQQEHIATLSHLEGARFLFNTQCPGGDNRRCLQCFQRRKACFDVELYFTMK